MQNRSSDPVSAKQNLVGNIIRGSFWIFIARITGQGISFISTIILARLLSPLDFGILGIAMLAIYFLETFSTTGFNLALVQKDVDIHDYLDAAWFVSVVRGLILGISIYLISPIVAQFFNSPNAMNVLKILAISPILRGLNNIGIVYFSKDMKFNKVFYLQIAEMFGRSITSIILAFLLKNVYALVFGILASRIIYLTMSYILHPYRPRLKFDYQKAKELFTFGKWLLGSSILKYTINQGDKAVVGKLIDSTSLGFYTIAYRISMLPVEQITKVVSQVMFPAFSKIQSDNLQLSKRFLETLQILSFFSIPFAGMIFLFSNDFVSIFLGAKWLPAVPIIHIFAFLGLITSISSSTGSFFQAIGKPKIVTSILTARLIIIAIIIYPLTSNYGIQGAALTVLISAIILDPFAIFLVCKISKNSFFLVCKSILIPFLNTLTFVILVIFLKQQFFIHHELISFMFFAILSIALYVLLAYFFEKVFNEGSFTKFRKIFCHLDFKKAI